MSLTTEKDYRVSETTQELWNRSRIRWRSAKPDNRLTWGKEIMGDNFILKVLSYNALNSEKNVLEIGPGYGRLLRACLQPGPSGKTFGPFRKYFAIDISPHIVRWLRKKFPMRNIHFIQGDVEKVLLEERFDVVLSSLTFKHFFPSFENALSNVVKYIKPGGMLFFDLLEGEYAGFVGSYHSEENKITYIRCYAKTEILQILYNLSLKLVAFDEVWHDLDHRRLLVVAEKPKQLK